MDASAVSSWVEHVDPCTQRKYWGNINTKVTTWQEPEVVTRWRAGSKTESFVEVMDDHTKMPYYVSKTSKSTTWIKPLGKITSVKDLSKDEHEEEEEAKQENEEVKQDEETTDQEKTEDMWVKCIDRNRNKNYYFNAATKVPTWTKPSSGQIIDAEEWKLLQYKQQYKNSLGTTNTTENKSSLESQESSSPEPALVAAVETIASTTTTTSSSLSSARLAEVTSACTHLAHHEKDILTANAMMHNDGSVSGWAARRRSDGYRFEHLFIQLKGELLECRRNEGDISSLDTFVLDALSTAVLSEDPLGKEFMFVIEVTSMDAVWFLGIDSIEDMQLWLEALQIQARKTRVASVDARTAENSKVSTSVSLASSSKAPDSTGSLTSRLAPKDVEHEEGNVFMHHNTNSSLSSSRRRRPQHRRFSRRTSSAAASQGSSSPADAALNPEDIALATTPQIKSASFALWCEQNGFDDLCPCFADAGYDDLDLIVQLNDDELKEMLVEHVHVEQPGRRMKIVVAVRNFRQQGH